MSGLDFRAITRTFRDLPSPADVAEVIRATPLGALVTILNAVLFTVATWDSLGGLALASWLLGTIAMSTFVLRRSLRARKVRVTRVSQRAARRLLVTSLMLAMPWSLLSSVIIPFGGPSDRLIGLLASAGMAFCAALMLQRTLAAAVTYVVAVNLGILAGCLLTGELSMLVIAVYAILSTGFVTYNAYFAGLIAKERDRMLERLSTANRRLEEAYAKVSSFVFHDVVTGLPNRKAFMETLEKEVETAQLDGRPRSVMIFDLDNFKNINDSFGHLAGDELLALTGARIADVIGNKGMAARLGGDEFGVLSTQASDIESLQALADALIAAVSVPAMVVGRQIYPGTSIGIATLPEHSEAASELMQKADAALARAKERGKGGYFIFDHALGKKLEDSEVISSELTTALETKALSVHYQPKIHLASGMMCGAEALVRWNHPTLGVIRPTQFLPVAAERAMMHELSEYIFERVAQDILDWREAGLDIGPVSINIHPVDLKKPDHLMRILRKLADRGIGPGAITLELTEECLVGRGTEAAPMILDTVADMGYGLSLDDFGTGHAALGYLRHLPVDEIKIDQAFVANLSAVPSDRSMVEATITFARGMGLKSVAEGVETIEQIDILLSLGTDFAQGFFWSRPLIPHALVEYVKRHGVIRLSDVKRSAPLLHGG